MQTQLVSKIMHQNLAVILGQFKYGKNSFIVLVQGGLCSKFYWKQNGAWLLQIIKQWATPCPLHRMRIALSIQIGAEGILGTTSFIIESHFLRKFEGNHCQGLDNGYILPHFKCRRRQWKLWNFSSSIIRRHFYEIMCTLEVWFFAFNGTFER